MFECDQTYPEHNAPYEGKKRVKSLGTDHKSTEFLKSESKKRNSDFILATQTRTDMSRTQYTREWLLPAKYGHRMARSRPKLVKPIEDKNE